MCPKVLPCTFDGCGKPAYDPWVHETLSLYQDCNQRNCLPYAGGVMDQPNDIMNWFRVLDEKKAEHRKRVEAEEALRRLPRA